MKKGKSLSFIDHFNNNQGFWNFILTLVIILIATASFYFSLNDPERTEIQLYTNVQENTIDKLESLYFNLYIYNSGNIPCFKTEITTGGYIQNGFLIYSDKTSSDFSDFKPLPALYSISGKTGKGTSTTLYINKAIQPKDYLEVSLKAYDEVKNLTRDLRIPVRVECGGKSKEIFVDYI